VWLRKHLLFLVTLLSINVLFALAQNIFLTSIPKAGTHMLAECVSLLTGKSMRWLPDYSRFTPASFKNLNQKFLVGHGVYSDYNVKLFEHHNCIGFFIYRDPRDQLLSPDLY